MKKIVVLEPNESKKNPAEVVMDLFRKGNNISVRPIEGDISYIYSIGGQTGNIDNFINLLEKEGIKIVSIKEVRNNNPVKLDTVRAETPSIIPT